MIYYYIFLLIISFTYPITAIILLLKFNKLEKQVIYYKSICEQATHISMIAEEQSTRVMREFNMYLKNSKKQKDKAFWQGRNIERKITNAKRTNEEAAELSVLRN